MDTIWKELLNAVFKSLLDLWLAKAIDLWHFPHIISGLVVYEYTKIKNHNFFLLHHTITKMMKCVDWIHGIKILISAVLSEQSQASTYTHMLILSFHLLQPALSEETNIPRFLMLTFSKFNWLVWLKFLTITSQTEMHRLLCGKKKRGTQHMWNCVRAPNTILRQYSFNKNNHLPVAG